MSPVARNVSETAMAAREVASNIELVSSEARSNMDTAARVRSASEQVKDAIENLKQVVVRVVRTSAPEVDRREQQRSDLREPGTLTVGSSQYDVTVTNLSEGGVGVELSAGAELPSAGGGRAEISSPSLGRRQVTIAGKSGRNIGLRFAG
jgi:methyl-accepting chemotaxis protein